MQITVRSVPHRHRRGTPAFERILPRGSRLARSPATTTTRRRAGTGTCCPRSGREWGRGAPRSRDRRAGPTRARRTTSRARPGCPRASSRAGRRGDSGPRGRRPRGCCRGGARRLLRHPRGAPYRVIGQQRERRERLVRRTRRVDAQLSDQGKNRGAKAIGPVTEKQSRRAEIRVLQVSSFTPRRHRCPQLERERTAKLPLENPI